MSHVLDMTRWVRQFSKCFFDMLVWNIALFLRAGHVPLGLVVPQFCKVINTSPMFSNFVGNTASLPLVISIKAQAHRIWLMQILSLISFNLCRLLPRQIKRCVVRLLFVAAFCWRKRAFYVRIVGAMGIKCWWIAQLRHSQRTWIWDA